jgi:hypothetical protein
MLFLPTPVTQEAIVLVMIAYLCSKILAQEVEGVDICSFRQSLCYYYDKALRGSEVDSSSPWPGITDENGRLLTSGCNPAVERRRFSLAANEEPLSLDALPRRRSYPVPLLLPSDSDPFFAELALPVTRFAEDMLVGTSGRSLEDLQTAVFLGQLPSWPDHLSDHRLQQPDALSLNEYYDLVHAVGGPESIAGQRLLVTGEYEGSRVRLDWLKDAAHLEKEWLMAGTDVDSLSLTTQDAPLFLQAGSFYPYPSRALTVTARNNLQVNVSGTVLEMHTCEWEMYMVACVQTSSLE